MKRTHRPRRRLVGTVVVALALGAGPFGPGPFESGPTASAAPGDEEQTWFGDVEKHGRHYDYLGRPCPIEESDPCPEYEVTYEIVPTTAQAARALPKVAGHRARLIGHRQSIRKPRHSGTLMVSEVRSNTGGMDPLDRVEPRRGSGGAPRN
jgi:hypothetical protein